MSNPKKYYWLKLFDNFFADPKIKKLRRLAGGDTYLVILLKMMLNTIKNDGVYVYEGIENTLAKELELVLDEDADHIQAVLIFSEKNGLIKEISENQYLMTNVPKMIGKEGASAERMRRLRSQQASHCDTGVLPSDTVVISSDTEREIEREIKLELDSLSQFPRKKRKNFSTFRANVVDEYMGKELVSNVPGFLPDTVIAISTSGLLLNKVSNEPLNKTDAFMVWEWLYKNPEVIAQGVQS